MSRLTRLTRLLAICIASVALTSCIGVTERAEFDAIIKERGGGVSSDLASDAIATVAQHLDTNELSLLTVAINSGQASVTITAQNPAEPENLDTYVVSGASIVSETPVQLSAEVDLDQLLFSSTDVAFALLETMSDEALAEFSDDGFVTQIRVSRGDDGPQIEMDLESLRRRGLATFTGSGTLIEVTVL